MKKSISLAYFILFITATFFAQHDQQVDSLIHNYYEGDKPGIALAIIKDGQTIYNNETGLANLEYNIPISDSTSFLIASVSKQFTAYLALLLEQERKLKMTDDVRNHLPELKDLPYKFTLEQLANHTHGLPNISELVNVKGFGISDRMWHRGMVDMALRIKTFNFQPGEDYQYNNTGFLLLAEIIERVAEMPFQAALKEYIFNPLAMENSMAVPDPNLIIKNKSESYTLTNNGYQRYEGNIMSNGSAGIRTTIKDLAKWAKHFQATAKNSDSPFMRMIEKSQLNSGEQLPYGLGLETKAYKGLQAVFHGGGTAGHRAYTLHIPAHNFSVMVLGNGKDYWPLKIAYQVVDLYLNEFQTEPAAIQDKITATKPLTDLAGTYEFSPGNYYVFTTENDSLFLGSLGSSDKMLLPQLSGNTFEFPFYPEARFVFQAGRADLYIADFIYRCAPVNPILKKYATVALQKFTGFYHSESLNTTYEILVENDQLIARHPINYDIPLIGLKDDSFYSQYNFFGKIDFVKNIENEVTGFKLSGQNMVGLNFQKIGL
ncbi:MAG: serine hydrolase domain-containing protein [Saprospiraceae bacterium]